MTRNRGLRWAAALVVFSTALLGWATVSLADGDNHALPFARTGVGARAYGLGNAYVALADDATAGFFNPAGLTRMEKWGFASMLSAEMNFDRKFNYLAVGGNFDWGAVGASVMLAGIDDIQLTDGAGASTGTLDFQTTQFILSYANCAQAFHWGLNFHIVSQDAVSSGGSSETGVGGDIGAQWDFHKEATVGLAVQHVGLKIGDDDVPVNIRLGLAVQPVVLEGFTFPVEIQKTQHRDHVKFRIGGEYAYLFEDSDVVAALRGGVDDGGLALGGGVTYGGFTLDYAYITEKEDVFGEQHKFSLIGNF